MKNKIAYKRKMLTIEIEFTNFKSISSIVSKIEKTINERAEPYGIIEHHNAIAEYYLRYTEPSRLKEKDGLLIIKK